MVDKDLIYARFSVNRSVIQKKEDDNRSNRKKTSVAGTVAD